MKGVPPPCRTAREPGGERMLRDAQEAKAVSIKRRAFVEQHYSY